MADPFVYGRRGITGRLEDAERELLRGLFNDVVGMLEPEESAHADPLEALVGLSPQASEPEDPALARLLPNAVKDDAEASLEFRRLTERSLRQGKVGALRAAARHWSTALNDVRLVLAERLSIRSEEDAERIHAKTDWSEAEDVETYLALVYNFVTWLQTTLIEAMLDAHRVRSAGTGSGNGNGSGHE